MVQPVWRLERVLDFWVQFGERLSRGHEKPRWELGKGDYLTIPPRWINRNGLDLRVDDEIDESKIPVLRLPDI